MREKIDHVLVCGCGQTLELTNGRGHCPRCGQDLDHLDLDLPHLGRDLPRRARAAG